MMFWLPIRMRITACRSVWLPLLRILTLGCTVGEQNGWQLLGYSISSREASSAYASVSLNDRIRVLKRLSLPPYMDVNQKIESFDGSVRISL